MPAYEFVCRDCQPASGPVVSAAARQLLDGVFHRPPDAVTDAIEAAPELEGFHHQLIAAHLERDLRSYRVLRDVARGSR